jgi:S1-C subfamily serine protease
MRTWFWAVLAAAAAVPMARGSDLDDAMQKATQDAMKKVAPMVVKIETSGGTEVVRTGAGPRAGVMRRGVGPTTGLMVHPDGYVITSSFNFANKPTTIRVVLHGGKDRKVARVIATDQTRMLTLLKLQDVPAGTKYPICTPLPKSEIVIGSTALAIGKTLAADTDELPSVSVGIVSATDRIWGRAVQTDAKVSPTNYGGPLTDLEGRVIGVLVPASPQAEGELAGFEWYDSGIGFAIPLEDINAALPRLMKGTEKDPVVLKRGVMGVTMRSGDELFATKPVIGTVAPGSAGEKNGLKPGDLIKSIEGKAVNNFAQMLTILGTKYEGDAIKVVIEREGKDVTIEKFILGGLEAAFNLPFLGILPVRDDPAAGVEVRYVYPKSPADLAGIKEGDRIMKASNTAAPPAAPPVPINGGRNQLMTLLSSGRPGQEVTLEVQPKAGGAAKTLKVKLGELPEEVPAKLPEKASAKWATLKPGEKPPAKPPEKKKIDTGLVKKTLPTAQPYWVYIPEDYNPNVACAVVIWLHPMGKGKERDIEDFTSSWSTFCDDHNVIMLCPFTENPAWNPADSGYVQQTLQAVFAEFTVDRRRVVAHGMGLGGEFALYLGFQMRADIRGVATVGAHMASNPRERIANQPLSFYLVAGSKDPVSPAVKETKEKLAKFRFPAMLRVIENMGHEYLDGKLGAKTLEEMMRWVDSLDRI